jgi:hypothetical protein
VAIQAIVRTEFSFRKEIVDRINRIPWIFVVFSVSRRN